MSKKTIQIVFILYIAFLLYLTIFSRHMYVFDLSKDRILYFYQHVPNWQPFDSITLYMNVSDKKEFIYNVIGNIALFIPITFLSGFIFKHSYTSLLIAFGLTWSIEISQLILICGSFDIDDILLNLLGAFIGFLLFHITKPIISKKYIHS